MRRDTSCRACRGQSAVGGSRGLGARRSVVRGARPGSGWTGRGTGGGGRGGGAGPRGGRVARGDGGYPGERPARAMSQEQGAGLTPPQTVPGRRIPGHWPSPGPEALAVAETVTPGPRGRSPVFYRRARVRARSS